MMRLTKIDYSSSKARTSLGGRGGGGGLGEHTLRIYILIVYKVKAQWGTRRKAEQKPTVYQTLFLSQKSSQT